MTTQLITQPYHLPRDGGLARWHLGALLTFKATSEQTAGRLWAKELLAERGMATPVHRHSREDEAFYVLDGDVSVYVGDDVVRAGAGDFLWAPRAVPHAFCVESAQARLLVVSTPGGFDRFFFDTGEPAAALTVPPVGALPPPDPDLLVAALAPTASTSWPLPRLRRRCDVVPGATIRRYEVLLPIRFNDGQGVVETCMQCVPDTLREVVDRFGALTVDPRTINGVWTTMGMRYDDELLRLTVDVPDTDDSRHWIVTFKKELLTRFDQLEIYIVSHPIEVH